MSFEETVLIRYCIVWYTIVSKAVIKSGPTFRYTAGVPRVIHHL